jgi:hypothetical protein
MILEAKAKTGSSLKRSYVFGSKDVFKKVTLEDLALHA